MRKKGFLAGAMALAAGAMIGAVSPSPVDTGAITQRQIAKEQADAGGQPTKNQPAGKPTGGPQQAAREIEDFGKSLVPRPSASGGRDRGFNGKRRNWCVVNRSGRFNRTTRSRRQRRKHRRA